MWTWRQRWGNIYTPRSSQRSSANDQKLKEGMDRGSPTASGGTEPAQTQISDLGCWSQPSCGFDYWKEGEWHRIHELGLPSTCSSTLCNVVAQGALYTGGSTHTPESPVTEVQEGRKSSLEKSGSDSHHNTNAMIEWMYLNKAMSHQNTEMIQKKNWTKVRGKLDLSVCFLQTLELFRKNFYLYN